MQSESCWKNKLTLLLLKVNSSIKCVKKSAKCQKSYSEGTKELFYLTEDEANQIAFLHLFSNTISVQNTGVSMDKGGRNELKSCLLDTITVFFLKHLVVLPKKSNLSLL